MKTLDAGQAETNKLIEKVEKRVNKEYSQATKDMQKKLNNYLKSFESKDKAMQKQLADGLITDKQYKDWRYGQIMVGKRWQEQLDVLSKDLENSRQIAMNIVSGELPSAYAIGHNYGTFLVENGSKLNTSYTLYDRDTVSKLLKDRPKLLPDPTKGSKTQQALKSKQIQKWSKAKMTSAVAQGVLQGEAIPKIASRLRNVTDMSYRASIRNARTMLTSCENLGRQASFERAQDMGIEMEKQWLATLDDRTRDSHALMDGERVPLDENFSNGLEYPADPSGEPEEIYNCRCTMVTAIKGFEKALTDFDLSENEKLGDMTYEEWKDSHLHNDDFKESEDNTIDVWQEFGQMTASAFQDSLYSDNLDDLAHEWFDILAKEASDEGVLKIIYWDGLKSGKFQSDEMEKFLQKCYAAKGKTKTESAVAQKIANATTIKPTKKAVAEFDADSWMNSLKANEIHEFEQQTAKWMNVWNYSEKDALNEYTSSYYGRINNALRGFDNYPSERTEDDIKFITKALSKTKTEEEIILRRGSGYNSFSGLFGQDFSDELARAALDDVESLSQKISGTIGQDKAFMSTTPSSHGGFDSDINYIIRAPKGTEGAYIAPISEFKGEQEFLLQRGTKFMVREVKVGTGSADWDVYLDIIGQEY